MLLKCISLCSYPDFNIIHISQVHNFYSENCELDYTTETQAIASVVIDKIFTPEISIIQNDDTDIFQMGVNLV